LIGSRWSSIKDPLRDAAIALAVWFLWTMLSFGWDRWLGPDQAASIQSFLPRGGLESAMWIALSLSAGFCEELVFRGYAQRQFEALTHSRWIALCLQAVLFGVSHGYGDSGVRQNYDLRSALRLAGALAPEPAARHDGSRMDRHLRGLVRDLV
jgi:CAAX protease family protein